MKRLIQCVSLILVFAMVLAVPVSAMENGNQRASDYFAASRVYFEHVSGSSYEIWFEVTGTGWMDELGVKKITLQRSSDEVNWSSVATFSKDNYSQMVNTSGAVTHVGYVDCTCTSGYYYRALVELYAKDGNTTATMTVSTTQLDLT